MGAIFLRSGFDHVDNVITKRCSKQSHGCSCQGCKATNHTVILRNLPNHTSGTYTSTHRNSPEPSGTPEPSGAFRNFPPEPTPAHTGTLQNLPEPSGTLRTFRNLPPEPTPARCFQNLHQHTPELSGTFRNVPPEPRPAHRSSPEPSGTYTSTRRNSPELSGTFCSCNPHRHTPELVWAEDPISLITLLGKNKLGQAMLLMS